jgi:hypothetical protein
VTVIRLSDAVVMTATTCLPAGRVEGHSAFTQVITPCIVPHPEGLRSQSLRLGSDKRRSYPQPQRRALTSVGLVACCWLASSPLDGLAHNPRRHGVLVGCANSDVIP